MNKKVTVLGRKEIIAGGTFQNFPTFVPQASAEGYGIENIGGRFILRAGTIYPANDATAKGIVYQDYDLTDSGQNVALVQEGFVVTDKLNEPPSAEANTALKNIVFK